MHIAFLGIRGIPANYSGFESFVENLGLSLTRSGHTVTVYNRKHWVRRKESTYKGINIVRIGTIRCKYLDTIVHTFLSVVHALFCSYDLFFICNVGNAWVACIPKLLGRKVVLHVDGLEWQREKWNSFAKRYFLFNEWIASKLRISLVTDSPFVQRYYRQKYRTDLLCVSYGGSSIKTQRTDWLRKYGLEEQKYILFVGRLVPENGAMELVRSFGQLDTSFKLVVVGGAPYCKKYIAKLKEQANDRVIFTDYVYGEGYRQLSNQCYFFVLPSFFEATRPVLIEQMWFGSCILASDTVSNRMILKDMGYYFSRQQSVPELQKKMNLLLKHPEVVGHCRSMVKQYAQKSFTWEGVTAEYEKLFATL